MTLTGRCGQKGSGIAQRKGLRRQLQGDVAGRVVDGLTPQLRGVRVVMVARHHDPSHMIGRAHHVQRLSYDCRCGRGLIERVPCQQNMAGPMGARQRGQTRQDIGAGLPEARAHVLGKAPERFAKMQVGGVDEFQHGRAARLLLGLTRTCIDAWVIRLSGWAFQPQADAPSPRIQARSRCFPRSGMVALCDTLLGLLQSRWFHLEIS